MILPTAPNANDHGIFHSPTFDKDLQIHVNEPIGSATIAPSGRDVALASKHGLHIVDLDSPYAPPRRLQHQTPWTPADAQWSPFADRYYWIVTTSNQRALVWNLEIASPKAPIEFVLHAHNRAITDINFSAFHPDILATCAVDGFVHTWDLRIPERPAISLSDWFAGATQVKWNRKDPHIIASSHDRFLRIWDDRKGAVPLSSIDAHATKIYGVDWNRLDSTKIITCSLDRTIKLWDYSTSDVHPERVIRTDYPVWRARHTPFGEGILVMPQRGDHRIHLYDRKQEPDTPYDAHVEPVYSFKGHEDSVKEFLWRARGTVTDGHDNRDFQLVTWGNDQELILHKMRDKYFRQVGHEKGMRVERTFPLTRRGSPYKSFQNSSTAQGTTQAFRHHKLWQDRDDASAAGDVAQKTTESPDDKLAVMSRPLSKSVVGTSLPTVINWMRGVKFGKGSRSDKLLARRPVHHLVKSASSASQKESLSDEIIHVSDIFSNVEFEDVDVKAGHARVALSGPWSIKGDSAYVVLDISFPKTYPGKSCPRFMLAQSSALTEERSAQLLSDLDKIAEAHLKESVGCLESILHYLIGEHTFKQSIAWVSGEHNFDDDDADRAQGAESSSDEEDTLGDLANAESQILQNGDMHQPSLLGGNAGAPIPKACGAIWAPNGTLVCFFPPKAQPISLFGKLSAAQGKEKSDFMHEGLGRIHMDREHDLTPDGRTPVRSNDASDSEEDYSSDSSSGLEDEVAFPNFKAALYKRHDWGGLALKHRKRAGSATGSQRTSQGMPQRLANITKYKSILSIRSMEEILPAKESLAREYEVFGDIQHVCSHNGSVAKQHGLEKEAEIWSLLSLVLAKAVPLSTIMLDNQTSAFVVARRTLVDLQKYRTTPNILYDDFDGLSGVDVFGQVKWAAHPFGAIHLIETILEYFEQRADIQMLAVLSCVLAEYTQARDGSYFAAPFGELCTIGMEWPGYRLPYFPSDEIAITSLRPQISITEATKILRPEFEAYGSSLSSDGHREMNLFPSDLPSPISAASTPPIVLSRANTGRSSLMASTSISPDINPTPPSTVGFAASVWSRPFPFTNTSRRRESEIDLPPTSYTSPAGRRASLQRASSKLRSVSSAVALASPTSSSPSTSDDEGPQTPGPSVKVTLHNQSRFEDESHCTRSLIPRSFAVKLPAYRRMYADMLVTWDMPLRATEVRRFDGDFSYARCSRPATPQGFDDGGSQITTVKGGAARPESADMIGAVPDDEDGPVAQWCCLRCGHPDAQGRTKCTRCGAKRKRVRCAVCSEIVSGLYKACWGCGHVAHAECVVEEILRVERHAVGEGMSGDADEGHGAGLYQGRGSEDDRLCDVGCGCDCVLGDALQIVDDA